jgi:NADPH:quinone reductase-like Zn-dependent oxidoreductase
LGAAHYPDSLSPLDGTAIWMPFLPAFGALVEFGRMQPNDSVLITAASSSVGLAAIQIVKAAGAQAIATTRGADKKPFLLEAGADQVIVTDEENLAERVMDLTAGQGARLAFDPVAGPFLEQLAAAAAPGGLIFAYGALSAQPTPFPLFAAIGKGLTVRGYTLFEIVRDPEKLARAQQYVFRGLQGKLLRPQIDRIFPLDAIADAHRYMESNRQRGKIVVRVRD